MTYVLCSVYIVQPCRSVLHVAICNIHNLQHMDDPFGHSDAKESIAFFRIELNAWNWKKTSFSGWIAHFVMNMHEQKNAQYFAFII